VVKIICGLGNHPAEYQHTRHNLGFDIIDRLGMKMVSARPGRSVWFEYVTATVGHEEIHLIKPLTFVNRSGIAVAEAMRMFGAEPSELFVITDDFNLPLGTLRIRKSGSAGGHHGLESIIAELGRGEFPRLRAGIGPLPEDLPSGERRVIEFVLGRFRPEEEEIVKHMISQAVEAMELVMAGRLDAAIQVANSANPTPGD
jgi:peptidyl-tRNA hydrolase, PTH1 family